LHSLVRPGARANARPAWAGGASIAPGDVIESSLATQRTREDRAGYTGSLTQGHSGKRRKTLPTAPQPDQEPQGWDDHVCVYEEVFEPFTRHPHPVTRDQPEEKSDAHQPVL
jgi:hypothetical protein